MKIENVLTGETTKPGRRSDMSRMAPAELAIMAATEAVEHVGAHPLLTDSVVLLADARRKLADYIDADPEHRKAAFAVAPADTRFYIYNAPELERAVKLRERMKAKWDGQAGPPFVRVLVKGLKATILTYANAQEQFAEFTKAHEDAAGRIETSADECARALEELTAICEVLESA